MADNVASGIEPVRAWQMRRPVHRPDGGTERLDFDNPTWRRYRARHPGASLPPAFITAQQMTALNQLRMLEAVIPFIDAAVSKTVHPGVRSTAADVDHLLRHAWRHGLKGLAVYRPNAVIAPLLQAPRTLAGSPCRNPTGTPP
jgi:ribonucleoside-diphosphate reductase alpha chain